MRAKLNSVGVKTMKSLLKIGVIINSLTYLYAVISMLSVKGFPFHFYQSIEKKIVVFLIEVAIIFVGYFMITHYKVFTESINRLLGVIFIWPVIGFALALFNIDSSLIVSVLLIIGGGSIVVSIFIIHRLKDMSIEDILIYPRSGESLSKSSLILKGIIMWFIVAMILVIILSKI